jgi:hypothetical protein
MILTKVTLLPYGGEKNRTNSMLLTIKGTEECDELSGKIIIHNMEKPFDYNGGYIPSPLGMTPGKQENRCPLIQKYMHCLYFQLLPLSTGHGTYHPERLFACYHFIWQQDGG